MLKVKLYDSVDDSLLKFAVIISKSNGKWVFCKQKERSEFSGKLDGEMEKVVLMEELPESWTYPLIQPRLIEEFERRKMQEYNNESFRNMSSIKYNSRLLWYA